MLGGMTIAEHREAAEISKKAPQPPFVLYSENGNGVEPLL